MSPFEHYHTLLVTPVILRISVFRIRACRAIPSIVYSIAFWVEIEEKKPSTYLRMYSGIKKSTINLKSVKVRVVIVHYLYIRLWVFKGVIIFLYTKLDFVLILWCRLLKNKNPLSVASVRNILRCCNINLASKRGDAFLFSH